MERLRAAGAGPDHDLPFTDRVIVTLVCLRFQLPHAALAELYRVQPVHHHPRDRGGPPAAGRARVRRAPRARRLGLRTLADAFAYAPAAVSGCGWTAANPGPPPQGEQAGRRAFGSGKKKHEHQQVHQHH